MMRGILSLYSWRFPTAIIYMLQSTEYRIGPYLVWFWKTTNFNGVAHRRSLDYTQAARMLLLALRVGIALQVALAVSLIALWHFNDLDGGLQFGLAAFLAYPLVWAHIIALPLTFGRIFIANPKARRQITASERIFQGHSGKRVAIVGSYGKTSMKELLLTVLSEAQKVAATPANKNVSVSHASFARKLDGDEQVLLIEYGEGAPGDVVRFAKITHPTHAIITGLAPAHLDQYKTLARAGEDIFSVADYVGDPAKVYVNADSLATADFLRPGFQQYSQHEALGWKVGGIQIGLTGLSFTLAKRSQKLTLSCGLLGRHQIGPLAIVAALALEWGMTPAQVQAGVARVQPYEHRMQPYILGGAHIIDDTYNGNIEGIRAGTALLRELPASRKIYITPGLVDQGAETQAIHEQIGQLIADAQPDIVVLMQNSVTAHIQAGLRRTGFAGELRIESDPLTFYTSLDSFVAAGDVVLMQNDWPDNYA